MVGEPKSRIIHETESKDASHLDEKVNPKCGLAHSMTYTCLLEMKRNQIIRSPIIVSSESMPKWMTQQMNIFSMLLMMCSAMPDWWVTWAVDSQNWNSSQSQRYVSLGKWESMLFHVLLVVDSVAKEGHMTCTEQRGLETKLYMWLAINCVYWLYSGSLL